MDGTRVQVLRDIENWIYNPKAPQIFWLAGMAGTGKSAIAWTVCSRASADAKIIFGGSFFCSRSTGLVAQRDVRCVVPTLAQLLARQSPQFSEALADELARNPEVLHKQVTAQIEQLLYKPMLALKDSHVPIVFVIDALDECGGQTSVSGTEDAESHRIVSEMLEALVTFSHSSTKPLVKFFVTSRPETHIRDTPVSDVTFSTVLRLHTVNKQQVTSDIRLYISTKLWSSSQLRSRFTEEDVNTLARLCDGIFIVAATALRYALGAGIDFAVVRFRTLLNSTRDGLGSGAAVPLDHMYALIMAEAARVHESEVAELPDLQRLLASILSARMTLSVAALADLLDLPIDDLRASLSRLHAVVHIPDNEGEPGLRTLHASFGDYLFGRAPSHTRIPHSLGHNTLARACLHVMAKRLHFNISQSRSSYERNLPTRADTITLSLEYACIQWTYHAANPSTPSTLDEEIDIIFRPRFLFWLEVMSVLAQIQRATAMLIYMAASVSSLTKTLQSITYRCTQVQSTKLLQFLRDANSFVASSREAIQTSAPHIYLSALSFAAKDSLVFQTFAPLCTGLVTAEAFGIDRHGGRLIMTLVGHRRSVNSVVYSHDGSFIVSGSNDGTVRIWDTRTGDEMIPPLQSGIDRILSIAVAPDGARIASVYDKSSEICVWNLLAGHMTPQRLTGHSAAVWSVTFSPDSNLLASASQDTTVRIWKVETGQQLTVLRGHTGEVNEVAFAPDGLILASGSSDQTIRLWHSATGEPAGIKSIQHHVDIFSVCFAPDGTKLASGCADGTIRLLEPQTGREITKIDAHFLSVRSVRFSPDGRSLVSAADERRAILSTWRDNEARSSLMDTIHHTDSVRSAVFSPDGLYIAAASEDRTIRIWAAKNGQTTVMSLPSHNNVICSMTVSSNGASIVSASTDGLVCAWNAHTGDQKPLLAIPLELGSSVNSVAVSSDGRLIVSASNSESEIRLWSLQTEDPVGKPLWGHTAEVTVVVFSPDAQWLASGSDDQTVCIRNATTMQPLTIDPLKCNGAVLVLTFSLDGKLLAAGDATGRIHLWHVETGQQVHKILQANDYSIHSVSFSPDGSRLASAANDQAGRVWIVNTGKQDLILGATVYQISFSPNGRLIATASIMGVIGLWDAATGAHMAKIHGYVGAMSSITFMPDGESIVSGSFNGTIHIWNVEAACSLLSNDGSDPIAVLALAEPEEAWLLGTSGERLLWVPPDYQSYIVLPPCTLLIARHRVVLTADKSVMHAGRNWTACWRKDSSHLDFLTM